MPFKAVLFDMDGVLWLTNRHHEEAFRRILKQPAFDYSQHVGMKTAAILCRALQQPVEAAVFAHLVVAKRAEMTILLRECAPSVAEGTKTLLLSLNNRQIKTALVTGGSQEHTGIFFEQNHGRNLFHTVVTGDGKRGKPAPDLYWEAINALRVQSHECAVVEDSVAGVKAGKAAGAYIIGVLGTTTPEKLRDAGADCIVKSVAHLLGVL